MTTKIKNVEYDAQLEVRNWRHPAEIAIVREVVWYYVYSESVYGRQQNWGQRWGSSGYICEWQVGTPTDV